MVAYPAWVPVHDTVTRVIDRLELDEQRRNFGVRECLVRWQGFLQPFGHVLHMDGGDLLAITVSLTPDFVRCDMFWARLCEEFIKASPMRRGSDSMSR